MPGPGRAGKKTAPKPISTAVQKKDTLAPEPYVETVDGLSWNAAADLLCEVYKIPDLSTRSGLKKAYTNFDVISRRLDKAAERYSDNLKIVGGVIAVYTRMADDSLICRKLHEKGFLNDIDRLLGEESTRVFALQTLIKVTCFSTELRGDIIARIPALLDLLERYPNESTICEPIIDTLCHCVMAVYDNGPVCNDDIYKDVVKPLIPRIVRLVTDFVAKEWASEDMTMHAYELLISFYEEVNEAIVGSVAFQQFLIAGLSSTSWVTRSSCLKGLLLMVYNLPSDDLRYGSPEEFLDEVEESAPHLYEIMRQYGLGKCYNHQVTDAMDSIEEALEDYALTNNLYTLGLKLARLFPRLNRVHVLRAFKPSQKKNGGWKVLLPKCLEALRSEAKPEEVQWADILEVGYILLHGKEKHKQAVEFAAKVVGRGPKESHAFFYYAISHSSCDPEELQAHVSGTSTTNTNRHLRLRMSRRTIVAGCLKAVNVLTQWSVGKVDWDAVKNVATLLRISFKEAEFYLQHSAPDDPDRGTMASFFVILSFLIKGPQINLTGFDHISEIKKLSTEFCEEMAADSRYIATDTLSELILSQYSDSVTRYGNAIAKLDAQSEIPQDFSVPEKWEEDMVVWNPDGTHNHTNTTEDHAEEDSDDDPRSKLYSCAYCQNVSAVMRKCSRCLKTRYCDAKCQKAHWKSHKKECLAQRGQA